MYFPGFNNLRRLLIYRCGGLTTMKFLFYCQCIRFSSHSSQQTVLRLETRASFLLAGVFSATLPLFQKLKYCKARPCLDCAESAQALFCGIFFGRLLLGKLCPLSACAP